MNPEIKNNKAFKTIFILIITIILLSLISVFSSCRKENGLLQKEEINNSESSIQSSSSSETSLDMEESETDETAEDKEPGNSGKGAIESEDKNNPGKVVYLEIATDPQSNHFEHRVAKIFAKDILTGMEELIFSDIHERFEIGRVFSVSPDGKQILCDLVEGGRGAYSAICVINVDNKKMKILDEFDFTKSEGNEITLGYYGKPVWSSDSRYIAYETISNYFSSNIRDGGIYKVNVETGDKKEIELDVGGTSLRSTMFLSPVFFFNNDKNIACVSHFYFEKNQEDFPPVYETKNAEIFYISEESKEAEFIFDLSAFSNEGPENITSFDNFKFIQGSNSYIFQVLGDFEEDGDLWIAGIEDNNIRRFTNDTNLSEQQPDVFITEDSDSVITYIGVKRYGTISNQFLSGDIFLTDFKAENIEKITSVDAGAYSPLFSRDGNYIAYMKAVYDENYENILHYNIEAVNIKTKEVIKIS
ncbi:MAG: hypothetical protein PHU65_08150, partial [Actinomycetota bacterium]|nr:hypothetical protein [Actinomycetota bacterium]